MMAEYLDRRFQIWEYRVSHGSLLVRSPRGESSPVNVDLIFVGVSYVALPHAMQGVQLHRGGARDFTTADVPLAPDEEWFTLVSQGRHHVVVAVDCRVDENDDDIFASPF